MLAAGSSLIGLLVFLAIAVISAILKKRQEEPFEELPPELKPRRGSPSPQEPKARNWQEELRHLLEERSAPPPLVREGLPAARPHLPPPLLETEGDAGHIEVTLPAPQPYLEPQFHSLPGLAPAQGRYAEATQLQERVTRHMTDLTHHRVGTTSVQRESVTPEVRDVVGALRNPRTLRTAMMAAVILGPPRALEG